MTPYADCCMEIEEALRRAWVVWGFPGWRLSPQRTPIYYCPWCGAKLPEEETHVV